MIRSILFALVQSSLPVYMTSVLKYVLRARDDRRALVAQAVRKHQRPARPWLHRLPPELRRTALIAIVQINNKGEKTLFMARWAMGSTWRHLKYCSLL